MVTLLCIMVANDTNVCYKLFPIHCSSRSLHYTFYNMTQALTVQCIHLCFIILMTQDNSVPCSAGPIPVHLWGHTIKSKSHCLFKVIGALAVLVCNSLLYIFAGQTRHCCHPVQLLCFYHVLGSHLLAKSVILSQFFAELRTSRCFVLPKTQCSIVTF
jgi:hypothetical protein